MHGHFELELVLFYVLSLPGLDSRFKVPKLRQGLTQDQSRSCGPNLEQSCELVIWLSVLREFSRSYENTLGLLL